MWDTGTNCSAVLDDGDDFLECCLIVGHPGEHVDSDKRARWGGPIAIPASQ